MPTRDEPLEEIPMVGPASDEIESRTASRMAAPPKRGMTGLARFVLFLALLLAALALAAAAYLYQQMQAGQALLESAEARVAKLEERLSSTDESMTESTATQGVKIKELASEVDKLWASAWRKNQQEIGQYSKQLDSLRVKLDNSLKEQEEKLSAVQGSLLDTETLRADFKSLQSGALSVDARISELEESLDTVGNAGTELRKQMSELESWVESFNAYRKQVNERLNKLESANLAPVIGGG